MSTAAAERALPIVDPVRSGGRLVYGERDGLDVGKPA
jgi:hypothetical protein